MTRIVAIVGAAVSIGAALDAAAQPPASARIVGRAVSQRMDIKAAANTNTTVDTFTLRFDGAANAAAYTIDFIAQYAATGARTAPGVVDVVVTEHPAGDDRPAAIITVNGESMPVIARARQPRSIVTSLSFDDFMRIAAAESVVERAFDTELVLSAAQLRMLRATADRWAAR